MTVLLVTGSRDGHAHTHRTLDRYVAKFGKPRVMIAGDNAYRGRETVDHAALSWALDNDVFFVTYGADWNAGARGGPMRNLFMAMLASAWAHAAKVAGHCVGFPIAVSSGTRDCMEHAANWHLTVFEVDVAGTPRTVIA